MILVLPFTHQFARAIEKLIPDKASSYTQNLDKKFLSEPQVALTAVRYVIKDEYLALLNTVRTLLSQPDKLTTSQLNELQQALNETHVYIDLIHLSNNEDPSWKQLTSSIHALDHMQRLHERCEEEQDRAITARESVELKTIFNTIKSGLSIIMHHVESDEWTIAAQHSHEMAEFINSHAEPLREQIMSKIATGCVDIPLATDQLEGLRWLRRVSKHINRITNHLAQTPAGNKTHSNTS